MTSRPILGLSIGALAVATVSPAFAADYGRPYEPVFRPSYPVDWREGDDPLDFEIGLRYWYTRGGQDFELGGQTFSGEDESHLIEGHFRIDDESTSTYLKGSVGFAGYITNEVEGPAGNQSFEGGTLTYAGADLGYTPFDTGSVAVGGFAGYQYLNDSPNMGRRSFVVPDSVSWSEPNSFYSVGGDSVPNSIDVHALRLGVSGRADLGSKFDLTAEVAAIPYAYTKGQLGPHGFDASYDGFTTTAKSSATEFEGHLYGGAAEVMLGFHPTENFTIRAGARGYYLTGPVTATYSQTSITDPQDVDGEAGYEVGPQTATQEYVEEFDNFELFRWGPMVELTYNF